MVRTPEVPARNAAQVVDTSPPIGEVVPSPVTTTRVALMGGHLVGSGCADERGPLRYRISRSDHWVTFGYPISGRSRTTGSSAVLGALDEGDGVADRLEVLHLVVGDLDVE